MATHMDGTNRADDYGTNILGTLRVVGNNFRQLGQLQRRGYVRDVVIGKRWSV